MLNAGVLVSILRILTKAVYAQDSHGLRKSANLYFAVGIVVMAICLVFCNMAHRLPIMKYYADLKIQAVNEDEEEKGSLTGARWRSILVGDCLQCPMVWDWNCHHLCCNFIDIPRIYNGGCALWDFQGLVLNHPHYWLQCVWLGWQVFDFCLSLKECKDCHWWLFCKIAVLSSLLWLLARS